MKPCQCFRRRPVCPVNRIAPAEPLAEIRQGFTARSVEAAIVVRIGFSPTGNERGAGFRIAELGAARIGKCFFGRIGNFHQMRADTALCQTVEKIGQFIKRMQEIRYEDDFRKAADLGDVGQCCNRRFVHQRCRQTFSAVAGRKGWISAGKAMRSPERDKSSARASVSTSERASLETGASCER